RVPFMSMVLLRLRSKSAARLDEVDGAAPAAAEYDVVGGIGVDLGAHDRDRILAHLIGPLVRRPRPVAVAAQDQDVLGPGARDRDVEGAVAVEVSEAQIRRRVAAAGL